MTGRAGRAALAIGAAALILLATMPPVGDTIGGFSLWGDTVVSDIVSNLLLFAPFGAALAWLGWTRARSMLVAAGLSTAIELAQLFIPGRYTSPLDVLTNAAGAGLGWMVVRHARAIVDPPRGRARRMALVAFLAAATVFASTILLLGYAPTTDTYFGQWTPMLGQFGVYGGRLTTVTVDGHTIPDGPMERNTDVDALISGGAALRLQGVAGPRPYLLADLFSVADGQMEGILLVGADRDALVVRYRSHANTMGLVTPDLVFPDLLRALKPGVPFALVLTRSMQGWCAYANGAAQCGVGYSAGSGWGLAWFPRGLPAWLLAGLGWGWIAAVAFPMSFWGEPSRVLVFALLLGALLSQLPAVTHQLATSPGEYAGLAIGVGAGQWLRRRRAAMRQVPVVLFPGRRRA